MFEIEEPWDAVLESIGLRSSRPGPEGSESRRDAFVEVEMARLPALGAGGGGEGLAERWEATLTFLLSGPLADANMDDLGGVDACTEPLDGGGLGGGVRVLRSSNSYGGRGVPLLDTFVDCSAVVDPVDPGADGMFLDVALPFLGAGGSGALDASFSFLTAILSTVTQSSSPFSLHGLLFLSGLRTSPSLGG